ncbi:uncharacterized protein [Tenebrio molitor]|uniref:uncharacterized protein n=1 Tax=Tenebrio molitor TaxID=7067 RepID=UPI00362498E7
MASRLNSLAKATRVNPWPTYDPKDLDRYKLAMKRSELARWASLVSQGKSIMSFADNKIANAWLTNKKLLKPGNFISALRLRANVAGDRVALNRAVPGVVLSMRHWATFSEFSQGRVFVVDVTVRHEDGNPLAQGRQAKLEKYEPLLPTLQEQLGALSGEVLPIVVGTRRALPKETIEALKKLKITDRKTLLTISLIALRASIRIYHAFMDYNARPRPVGGANYPHR